MNITGAWPIGRVTELWDVEAVERIGDVLLTREVR